MAMRLKNELKKNFYVNNVMKSRESEKSTEAVRAWEEQGTLPSIDQIITRVRILYKEALGKNKRIKFRELIDQAMGELGVPKDQREDMRRLVGQRTGKAGGLATAEGQELFRAVKAELDEDRERADSRGLREDIERGGYEDAEEMHDDINK